MRNKTYKQKGFSLIEVMLAALVLGIGILAVSKLQTSLIRSGSDANHRAVAANIAQRKINDLRRFVYLTTTEISTPIEWDDLAVNADTGLKYPLSLAFTNIATDKGGRIQAGDISNGNDVYALSWTSDSYTYAASDSIATLAGASDDIAFKRVHVVVQWDSVGDTTNNVVSFDTIVDSYNFANTNLGSATASAGTGPQVIYNPLAAPDVIDIDVGGGKKRQTSKPLPTVLGGGDNTMVDFTVVTYHSNGSDSIADREEEFRTVDCKCELSGSTGYAYPPGHVLWDGADRDDNVLAKIEKVTATATNNNDSDAELACDACCRDHHDYDYDSDPDKSSDVTYVEGFTGSDHPHYNASGGLVSSPGTEYVESCRLKRIDGIFRVFQDWSLKDITVMERASLFDGAPLQTAYTDYQNDFILNAVTPSHTITHLRPALRSPVTMSANEVSQFEARGVYIDNVYDLNGNENPGSYLAYVASASKEDRLERIPFAEVNLSLLASWSSSDNTNVDVSNDPAITIVDPDNNYYGSYSRGLVTALVASSAEDITAAMRDDNHGLTQVSVIAPSPTILDDTVRINVGVAGTPFALTGDLPSISSWPANYPNNKNSAVFTMHITDGSGACVISNQGGYTCPVEGPWDGTLFITVTHPAGSQGQDSWSACSGDSLVYSPASPISTDPGYVFSDFSCN